MTIEKDIDITSARSVSNSTELSPGRAQSPGEFVIGSRVLSAETLTTQIRSDDDLNWLFLDEAMQSALADYSVNDVKGLLGAIIADSSLDKEKRTVIVSRVVGNQPHKTSEFKGYDKQNQDVLMSRESHRGDLFYLLIAPSLALFVMTIMGLFVMISGEGDFWKAFWRTPLIATLLFAIIAGAVAIANKGAHVGHYGDRAHETLAESKEKEDKKEQSLTEKKEQQARFLIEFSGANSTVSLTQVTEDYKDAQARIASYETDLDKALKYPAFNDISVPAVQNMVKQMRVCKSRFAVLSASDVNSFTEEVAELWVRIQTAEEEAKRIGLKSLDAEELKLLEKIKGLAAHAGDPTYSDDVRAGFYQQLRTSVNKLNENRTLVPTKIVAQIEQKAALSLEQTKKEEVPYV